jgi:hypothetical protein
MTSRFTATRAPRNAPAIAHHSEITRRLVESLWARAHGAQDFVLAARWRPDGSHVVLDDGAGMIGATILGDFLPFEPITGQMSVCDAMDVVLDCLRTADEDAAMERFREAMAANWEEISALHRKMFPTPPSDPAIRRMWETFGLVDPNPKAVLQ